MNSKLPAKSRFVWIMSACLVSYLESTDPARACDPNPDPLGLAGPHVVFINNCTTGTSIVANNANTREQAMNPSTPLRDPFGLRLTDRDSKLLGASPTDPVGDTVYIRGGTYNMSLISVWNRVVFWNESRISLKAYPGEKVTIRGSSFLPGGNPPNTFCYPIPAEGICTLNHMFQFWFCDDVKIEGINFVGNTQETVQIAGQSITGTLCAPYVLRFWDCDRLTLRNIAVNDFASATDIGLGHRYQLDAGYLNTEYMSRGLTVSYAVGLEMDHVQVRGSADDPDIIDQSLVPWNIAGFITESMLGDAANPIRVHDCTFEACAGNAVELSTVNNPQRNILFDHNTINTWKNGIQVGGSGLSENMEFRDNRISFNHYPLQFWGSGGYGIKIGNSNHVKITNSVIYNGDLDGIGIEIVAEQDPTGLFYGCNDSTIAHNTLYRAGSRAISLYNKPNLDGSIPGNAITGTRVINNLIYQINTGSALSSNMNNAKRELFLLFPHFEENQGYGNVFLNNLFVPARSDGKAVGSADFGHWQINGSDSGSWQCYGNPTLPGCGWVTCAPNAGCEAPTRYKYSGISFNSLQPYVQNNIDATATDPMFVNVDKSNFRLVAGSPAINHAMSLPDVLTDFDGVVRASGGGSTIGAFEFDPPIPGDLNCDSQVNVTDVSVLVLALTNPPLYSQTYNCVANGDCNQDGRVDGRDVRGFVDLLTP